MFDLNELPENEGPAGKASALYSYAAPAGGGRSGRRPAAAMARKAEEGDEDENVVITVGRRVVEEEEEDEEEEQVDDDEEEEDVEEHSQQVYYRSGDSTEIVRRLLRDQEAEQSFLRLNNPSTICYPSDWQPSELTTYDENDEIDTDNEVTVAALDARAILDSQVVSRLDSAVSLVLPTEPPTATFGISPRPEKLGQRTESSSGKYHSDFTNFHRHRKWDSVLAEKSDKFDDELNLASRSTLLYPGVVSSRKGKRAREEGSVTIDTILKLKRHARLPPAVVVADAYDGAGPSLSMSLDQCSPATAKNATFATAPHKISSKGEGSERREGTSLSFGESSLAGFESTMAVVQRALGHKYLGSKSNLGLSMSVSPKGQTTADKVESNVVDAVPSVRKDREGYECGAESMKKSGREVVLADAAGGIQQPSEKLVWQGKLVVHGYSATDVAAYCSADLQPTSRLWSLPQVLTVENLVKIQEFFSAAKQANAIEPILRLRLLPDAASSEPSFSSTVTILNSKTRGRTKDQPPLPEMLGWHTGSHASRNGVPASAAGSDYVFTVSPKFKQPVEAANGTSAKLYLVLGSSLDLVSTYDREVGKKLFKGVEGSSSPEENQLFGFLCISEAEGRCDDSIKTREAKTESSPAGVDISTTKEQVLVQVLPSNTIEVVADAFHNQGRERTDAVEAKMTCEDEAAVSSAEKDEEAAATDGNVPNIANDQKGQSSDSNHEKVKGKNENHSLRHNHSPTRDDVRKDRERQRDRDRDLRGREKEKDLSYSNKDVQRYLQHRSSDKADFSKRDRSKDREGDRFKERSHRDSHRDLADRLKSSRERIKEHEKPKRDREKEKEKERPFKKRDLSPEPEMGATEDLEPEKARSSAKQEDSHHHLREQSIKENRKRIRVESEEKYENNLTVSEISTLQSETEETKLGKSGLDATTETVRDVLLQDSRHAVGSGQVESIVQVTNTVMVESLGDAETDTPETVMKKDEAVQIDHKDHDEKPVEVLPVLAKQSVTPSSSTNALLQNRADLATPPIIVVGLVNTVVAEGCDTTRVMDRGVNGVKEETQEEGLVGIGEFAILKDRDDTGIPQSKEHAMEVLGKDMNVGQAESGGQNMNDGNVKVFDKPGEAGSIERTVPEPSYNPKEERTSDTEMLDDVQRSNSKILSVRVDGNCYPVEGPKSQDSQDSLLPPRRFLKDNSAPSAQKSVTMGGDDQHGSLMGVDSPSSATENGVQASSPGLLAEVSSETLLEGCDKETRSWLVSKQNACYLAEEFGVRIARIEEVFQAKSELQLKAQQGPFDLKVFLVTEKSTDSNEGKWFMNQAADMLQTLSARGVFTKCLWYEGLVQRYASDQGPSIPAVVRRIKGEDGKNLEKIEEETGIMIGIVLDGKTRKGIGNFTRVIGLRLRGTRKKGIQEATKQAGILLSQVAEQFSKGTRARSFESHDAALLKLKVDFSNNTSPSSGILTPMHKDVFAAYSPVSPVATISPLGSFKHKLEETSIEATHTAPPTAPTSVLPDSSDNVNPAPAAVADFASQSQQSEDEQPDKLRRLSDLETKYVRPLLVSNLPEGATTSMLRALFEDVLKEKFGLPSSYEGVSDMIADIRFSPDKLFAFVEFASDELLLEVLKIYADKKPAFFGLNLEMGSSASLNKLERMFLAARTESTGKGLEYGRSIIDSLKFSKSRTGRKGHKSDDHSMRVTSLRSSPESDVEVSRERRFGDRDGTGRYPREKPSPLFLTELMKNSSARSIHTLFEDIIKKYRNPSLGHFKARAGVLDVRFIPSRGCAFVDLSSAELVDFVLELHSRRPEVFHHMKMEIGRRPVPLGHGEEEPVHAVKRSNHLNRDAFVEESRGYGSGTRARGYFPSTSPPPTRRNVLAIMDHDVGDDYEEEEEDDKQPMSARKRRSDPERTVYADRLPENASEGMIRRIFERVLRDNMTDEQRELLGDNIITEVRYVPTKFCAFIVLVAEELTRLVLQLYNQDEEIFKNMRLKPHFHSRMEDLYREDLHDRDDAPVHRVLSRDRSTDRRSRRGMDDYHNGYPNNETGDLVHRSRHSAAHRAVAATAFKEVDRRRSVYVDRIPERLPEPKVRELFERAMRQHRHAYRSHTVSQVTFFRDKFDPEKLCAFVELEHEDMVQELLDIYSEDEEAFTGMRVRPAIKYGH